MPRLVALGFAVLSAAIFVGASSALSQRSGLRVDRTFGSGRGFVTIAIGDTEAVAYGAVVLPGGKIVIAGQASPPSGNGQVVVARYLSSGRLDRSFGANGMFVSSFPAADAPFIANAVARDRRTGKLVVAGGYGQGAMLVLRLTSNGRLDPTFGAQRSGFTTINVGGIANSVALQRNGAILLGGANLGRPGRPFVVARVTRNGSLDRTFGHRGVTQALFWNPTAASGAGLSLATMPDGGVMASGHIDYIGGSGGASGGHGTAGVFRLTRRGRVQRSFGTRGHVQVTFFSRGVPQSWYPCAMTTDRRGRITVTGGGGTHRSALFTARLTRRGALDRSYGRAGTGRVITPGIGGNAITTCGVTSTRAGQLTVAIQSTLAQLLPNGLLNRRFARRGVFTIARPKQVFINGLIRSGRRRLVAVGYAGSLIYLSRFRLP